MQNGDTIELLQAIQSVEKNLSDKITEVKTTLAGSTADHAARIILLEKGQERASWRQWIHSLVVTAIATSVSIVRGH